MNNEITELKFDILAKREENISKEANGLAKKKNPSQQQNQGTGVTSHGCDWAMLGEQLGEGA